MAAFIFENAVVKIQYDLGLDQNGEPKYSTKSYSHVKDNITPDQLSSAVQAIANLSKYPIVSAKLLNTDFIEL